MAYTAQWVNRIDHANHVEIDLNLVNGSVVRRVESFDFRKTPAQVDAAFLANVATGYINRETAKDTTETNVAAFKATNADLTILQANTSDIGTMITRNSLGFTSNQVKAFFTERLAIMNAQLMEEIARKLF